jgi:hypothetical protein
MPLETASGVGYVSSTLKAKARGVSGMAPKPKKARLSVKSGKFLLGRVRRTQDIKMAAAKEMTMKVSLNLWNLSKIIPTRIDPMIPDIMKTPPKTEF